jgi:phosphoglycolate phosphatase
MKSKTFKAILFDADGTLYDSTMMHLEAYQKVSRELYGFDFTEKLFFDECIRLYKKPTQVLRERGVACDDNDFYARKRPYFYHLARKKLKPTPGLPLFLKRAEKNDIPCVIVSGASSNSLEDSLNILGLKHFFRFRIAYEDSPDKQKPHPYPYELALARLGIPPEQGLAFEDTESGVASANGAGLFCIGIMNATNTPVELKEARLAITDLNQLAYTFDSGLKLTYD